MEKSRDIVITGIQAWDIEIGSNCKNIAVEMSKKHRVLYVNPPLDIITYLKNRKNPKVLKRMEVISGRRGPLEKINENLWVVTLPVLLFSANWLPRFLFNSVNKMNGRKKAINKIIQLMKFKKVNLFCDSDMFRSFYLIEEIDNSGFIYYSRDNLMTVPYWEKHGSFFEPAIMQKATMVATNSPHLQKLASGVNPQSFYVGQGCETEDYAQENLLKPKTLEGIKGVLIGYTGLLSSRRLSIKAIEQLAMNRPNYQIILVGPEEDCFQKSDLHQLKNVHFIGSVSPTELPGYVNAFDVCINPQVSNELTKGNYPRKIDEYLAAGKPTVATYTPTMEVFKDHCYLAHNSKDYALLVDRALKENSIQRKKARQEFAAQHTWANSVEAIWTNFNSIAV